MTPLLHPLLDRGARRRRRETLGEHDRDPAIDFSIATPFDPGCHTVRVPALPDDVRRHMNSVEYMRHETTGRLSPRRVPLILRQNGCDVVPWGLVPLVAQAARQRHPHPNHRPPPVVTHEYEDQPDPLVAAMLDTHHRAVLRYDPQVSPACLVAGLARTWKDRRIAVIVARRRDGGHMVRELRNQQIDAFGFFGGGREPNRPPQVAVGTPSSLAEPAAWHTGCETVVALDGVSIVGSAGRSVRYEPAWLEARWIGLVPADRPQSPVEHARLVCFFGPIQVDLPAHGLVRRRVTHADQRIHLPEGGGSDRVVMALAGALVDRDRSAPSDVRFPIVPSAAAVPGPVAVLAHDKHHQRQLQVHLRAVDRGRVAVITPAELSGLGPVGVLVRADRRTGCPPLPDHLLVEPQTDRTPLLFVDTHGPSDGQLLRDRVAAYRAAGWVGLAAEVGGYAEWESWTHRPLPGRASGSRTGPR